MFNSVSSTFRGVGEGQEPVTCQERPVCIYRALFCSTASSCLQPQDLVSLECTRSPPGMTARMETKDKECTPTRRRSGPSGGRAKLQVIIFLMSSIIHIHCLIFPKPLLCRHLLTIVKAPGHSTTEEQHHTWDLSLVRAGIIYSFLQLISAWGEPAGCWLDVHQNQTSVPQTTFQEPNCVCTPLYDQCQVYCLLCTVKS